MSQQNNHIDYLEFKAKDLNAIKSFYENIFKWQFQDYGPDYIAFSNSGIQGGFERSNDAVMNGVLVVLYHSNLAKTKAAIVNSKGIISREIFSFPGGRRFHFIDPGGNELAVWSDK